MLVQSTTQGIKLSANPRDYASSVQVPEREGLHVSPDPCFQQHSGECIYAIKIGKFDFFLRRMSVLRSAK